MKEKFTILPLFRFFSLLILLLLAATVHAGNALIQVVDTGHINWSDATAVAKGMGIPSPGKDKTALGSPSAILNAARQAAQTNLLDTVGAIRINATSRVADRMAEDASFREGLMALIQNAEITNQEYLSDGTVKIELTMKLSGGFGQFVLPEEIRQVDSITAVNAVEEKPSTPSKEKEGGLYSGLILDATGIDVSPSLVPVVVNESGEEVYGPAFVSREFAVSRGTTGFSASLDAARADPRVGERPMVVKVIRTHSTGPTDLVISNADAARLRSSVVNLSFLKACRVSIVLNGASRCPIEPPADSRLNKEFE